MRGVIGDEERHVQQFAKLLRGRRRRGGEDLVQRLDGGQMRLVIWGKSSARRPTQNCSKPRSSGT
jgi:hypothetical protein